MMIRLVDSRDRLSAPSGAPAFSGEPAYVDHESSGLSPKRLLKDSPLRCEVLARQIRPQRRHRAPVRSHCPRNADVTVISTDARAVPAESRRHGVIQTASRLGWSVADTLGLATDLLLVWYSGKVTHRAPEASRVFHKASGQLGALLFHFRWCSGCCGHCWTDPYDFFPLGHGPASIKEHWMPTAQLLPAIALTAVATSFVTAASAGLRAMGVARRSLLAQLTASLMYAIGGGV
jgi:hypothetical protein